MYSTVPGNIGIGTTAPDSKLSVGGPGSSLAAIYGGSVVYGIFGYASGASGSALHGSASGTSGRGVYGISSGITGRGVFGEATNTGYVENYGGYFTANGEYGHGVHGKASGTSGRGVYGEAYGSAGYGLYGYAEGVNGYGAYGYAFGVNGHGMHGTAVGTSGRGGSFNASGSGGIGVEGSATNSGDVTNYGGYFAASGTSGSGVYGYASGSEGIGVLGKAPYSGSATNYGGYFESNGSEGIGVLGKAKYIGDVTNYGGYFEASGTSGSGVYGYATGTEGNGLYGYATGQFGKGIYGKADSPQGYAGYFEGPGYFTNSVGIGAFPSLGDSKLTVHSVGSEIARFESNAQSNWISFYTLGTREGILWNNDGRMVLQSDNNGIALHTGGNNPRILIANSGNVGIGTVTPNLVLDVEGSSSGLIGRYYNTLDNSESDGIRITLQPVNPGTDNHFIEFVQNGGTHYTGYITGNGSGGTLYTTISDARLKLNIRDLSSALDKISKMNVKEYEMQSAPGTTEIGLLAQELQEIYPLAVAGNPYGNVEEEPMGIDYGRLTPLLVKAIQELTKRIEYLESN